jgi:predicted nucleic acid-binding protein
VKPFFDTSVLIAGTIDLGATAAPAQRLLEAVAGGELAASTAWHCCLEFYAVGTRLPGELRLTPKQALELLESEVLARFRVLGLPGARQRAFLRLCASDGVGGGRIYDAHIGEIAVGGGADVVVTENLRHFAALGARGVRVLRAADLVAELA